MDQSVMCLVQGNFIELKSFELQPARIILHFLERVGYAAPTVMEITLKSKLTKYDNSYTPNPNHFSLHLLCVKKHRPCQTFNSLQSGVQPEICFGELRKLASRLKESLGISQKIFTFSIYSYFHCGLASTLKRFAGLRLWRQFLTFPPIIFPGPLPTLYILAKNFQKCSQNLDRFIRNE